MEVVEMMVLEHQVVELLLRIRRRWYPKRFIVDYKWDDDKAIKDTEVRWHRFSIHQPVRTLALG